MRGKPVFFVFSLSSATKACGEHPADKALRPRTLQGTDKASLWALSRARSPALSGLLAQRAPALARALAHALRLPPADSTAPCVWSLTKALHAVAAVENLAQRLPERADAWAAQAAVWAPPLWRLLVARAPLRSCRVRSPARMHAAMSGE